MRLDMNGLWAPLVSPFYKAVPDIPSLTRLITLLEPWVDGFVPCLSSGEGGELTDEEWERIVGGTARNTQKPVVAGIVKRDVASTLKHMEKAAGLGCRGVMVALPHRDAQENMRYLTEISRASPLPVAIYNTETAAVTDMRIIREMDALPNIVALKDSSMNTEFFAQLCTAKRDGKIRMSVLQGMEHQLKVPLGCSGYLVSLLNLEPQLCRTMWEKQDDATGQEVMEKFWQCNLGADWYVSLKAILYARGVLASAEQVKASQTIIVH